LQKIAAIDPNFNSSLQSLISLSKQGLGKIEEEEKKRQVEIDSAIRKEKVKALLESAREYTKDRRVDLANKAFNEITQIEPENLEVTRMKFELDDWQKEKQRKELEIATKKKERDDKVEKLKPSRSLYIQKEWFKAITKLEDFLRLKDMDDDLTTEATEMLKISKEELNSAIAPLTGKAKSLLEGQDLKGAYEVYQQILRIEPSNAESLNQIGEIREQLSSRARKIYREAIIAESLSLFQDAKEKFQEVQQISPVDSQYYKKASDKLKDYLE
jgi:tetratricopeptide (TPR) repeat protein